MLQFDEASLRLERRIPPAGRLVKKYRDAGRRLGVGPVLFDDASVGAAKRETNVLEGT